MTDDVLKELWDTKDNIAKEFGYNIDGLAQYYLRKQIAGHGKHHQGSKTKKPEKGD